jgi:hypothetical protein
VIVTFLSVKAHLDDPKLSESLPVADLGEPGDQPAPAEPGQLELGWNSSRWLRGPSMPTRQGAPARSRLPDPDNVANTSEINRRKISVSDR